MITFNSNYIFPHSSSLAFICSGIIHSDMNFDWESVWLSEDMCACEYVCECVLTISVHNLQVFFAVFLHFFPLLFPCNWGYNRLRPNEIQHQLKEKEEERKTCMFSVKQSSTREPSSERKSEKMNRHNKRKLQSENWVKMHLANDRQAEITYCNKKPSKSMTFIKKNYNSRVKWIETYLNDRGSRKQST